MRLDLQEGNAGPHPSGAAGPDTARLFAKAPACPLIVHAPSSGVCLVARRAHQLGAWMTFGSACVVIAPSSERCDAIARAPEHRSIGHRAAQPPAALSCAKPAGTEAGVHRSAAASVAVTAGTSSSSERSTSVI